MSITSNLKRPWDKLVHVSTKRGTNKRRTGKPTMAILKRPTYTSSSILDTRRPKGKKRKR